MLRRFVQHQTSPSAEESRSLHTVSEMAASKKQAELPAAQKPFVDAAAKTIAKMSGVN